MNPIARYTRWLHTQWPAGKVERLPLVDQNGATNVPGVYVVGDLTGIPLLKLSADAGAGAVHNILRESSFEKRTQSDDVLDIVIIGAGVSGMAAALAAREASLTFTIFEAAEPFSTIANFPKAKPIYTYPTDLTPRGPLQFHEKSAIKEGLLEDLREQTLDQGIELRYERVDHIERRGGLLEVHLASDNEVVKAHRVIVGIGRSGNFRKLGVPGEDLDKVYNRLHDPKDYCGQNALVVGGGDSAMETAIALATCGANVTLSYRKPEFSRPKPENVEKLDQLVKDPTAPVQVEQPSSERVTTAAGGFTGRPKSRGSVTLVMPSQVKAIREDAVDLEVSDGEVQTVSNDVVFAMIGREPPLDFFRRSNVRISGEWTAASLIGPLLFLLVCLWVYPWKGGYLNAWLPGPVQTILSPDPQPLIQSARSLQNWFGERLSDPSTLLGTLAISAESKSFYYTLAYSLLVVIFGFRRMAYRKTRYINVQTSTLMAVQVIPLFILPEILLPWMGHNGWFADKHQVVALSDEQVTELHALYERVDDQGEHTIPVSALSIDAPDDVETLVASSDHGDLRLESDAAVLTVNLDQQRLYLARPDVADSRIASSLFPETTYGNGREYWRAYGFILAWPLLVGNWFTAEPLWGWFIIGGLQTFVLIPLLIYFWGKGSYCGWICSCGAMAETLGDRHRHKMWHGPTANRFNMVGQVILLLAFIVLAIRIIGWITNSAAIDGLFRPLADQYGFWIDLVIAGSIGYGLYFMYSGRVWCRFACPLAALMHIYARFSRFRILADKKKCISCNVCTSVCHQGIDIMNFANKGLPMADPECVRCSACVQMCPTGTLYFGRVDRDGNEVATDGGWLWASPVRHAELTINGQRSR